MSTSFGFLVIAFTLFFSISYVFSKKGNNKLMEETESEDIIDFLDDGYNEGWDDGANEDWIKEKGKMFNRYAKKLTGIKKEKK